MKIVEVAIPEYTNDTNIDLKKIAAKIDHALVENFKTKKVVLRAVSSEAHSINQKELVEIIAHSGTDRYDPTRQGDRYENLHNKRIDLFGQTKIIQPNKPLSLFILKGFHVYGAQFHKKPSPKMDIWMVYDRSQVKYVTHYYEKHKVMKRDGYIFKNQNNIKSALIGIIIINST